MRTDSSRYVGPRAARRSATTAIPMKWSVRDDASRGERISRFVLSSALVVFSVGMALGSQQTVLSGGRHVMPSGFAHETVDLTMAGSSGWVKNLFFENMNTAVVNPHVLEYVWMPYKYCAYAGAYVAAAATEYVEYVTAIAKASF